MKILVFSDLHFPECDFRKVKKAIRKEGPDRIVFLGDTITTRGWTKRFLSLMKDVFHGETIFIKGDGDVTDMGVEVYRVSVYGRKFVFLHGHQFPIGNEHMTYILAKFLKSINKDLPLVLFCLYTRMRMHLLNETLVVGHAHALRYFRFIKSICAGTMSKRRNVYNDFGYVVIGDMIRTVSIR